MTPRNGFSDRVKLDLSSGVVHRGEGGDVFRVTVRDDLSGMFMMEFELTPADFLKFINGGYFSSIHADVASPRIRERWGMVPFRESFEVPKSVTHKLYGDAAKQACAEWFENQPGSGLVDTYSPHANSTYSDPWLISTITYITQEAWEARRKLDELATEDDDEEEGDDDD